MMPRFNEKELKVSAPLSCRGCPPLYPPPAHKESQGAGLMGHMLMETGQPEELPRLPHLPAPWQCDRSPCRRKCPVSLCLQDGLRSRGPWTSGNSAPAWAGASRGRWLSWKARHTAGASCQAKPDRWPGIHCSRRQPAIPQEPCHPGDITEGVPSRPEEPPSGAPPTESGANCLAVVLSH